MRGVSGRCSGWLVDVCFFCLLSFYRLVFSFSAVRCSKAERKRKENGRQTGTLGSGGCTFWVLRLVVIVLFSSVQFSVSSSRWRHQGSISGVWTLWTAGWLRRLGRCMVQVCVCECVCECMIECVCVGSRGVGGWEVEVVGSGVPSEKRRPQFFFGGSSWNLSRPPSPAEAPQLLPLLCTWRSCYVFPLRAERDTTRREKETGTSVSWMSDCLNTQWAKVEFQIKKKNTSKDIKCDLKKKSSLF